jgi:hypothetical protein
MIEVKQEIDCRIRQGDIYRDVEFIKEVNINSGEIYIRKVNFPLVIVLTQDCDLEQDYTYRFSTPPKETQDKWLFSVLVAPIYNAAHVFSGEHLLKLGITMQQIRQSDVRNSIKNNQVGRYHYLKFDDSIPIVESIIDFKHYFSIDISHLQKEMNSKFVCSVSPLYRESISLRFANFLSRIGLPNQPEQKNNTAKP